MWEDLRKHPNLSFDFNCLNSGIKFFKMVNIKRGKLEIPSTLELIEIMINRKEWHKRTPFEKWSFFYGIGRTSLMPTGFTVFEADQTVRWYSYITLAYIVGYFFLALHTVVYYIVHGDFAKGLPCTCMFGVLISVGFPPSVSIEINRYWINWLCFT